MGNLTFNGVSMFANHTSENPATEAVFDDMSQSLSADNTMSIYVSSDGSSGPKVSINKALLLSALTVDSDLADIGTGVAYSDGVSKTNGAITFASETYADGIKLEDISVGVFTKALENLATLRADNGGTMSRLQYASDNATMQAKNFAAANGRIVDVDIAAESTNLAKYQILSQASASMIAQANSSMDIALMLLR
jgi:flagellin